jgi:hypothetical protein
MLMGVMMDLAIYEPHGGKPRLLCRGWYAYSTLRKRNLHFDCHYNENGDANHTSLHDVQRPFHVQS